MYDKYIVFAKSVAYQAGDIMRAYFNGDMGVELKSDETIVTRADKEINQMVIDRVSQEFPEHSVDGEEASSQGGLDGLWVCDPIDGTNPYAARLAVSVFSLAFVKDGEPLVGVIYDPFTDRMFWATKGGGAFINDQPTRVSQAGLERSSRVNYDQWSDSDYDVLTPLAKLSRETGVYLLSPGSATHMAALVAQGDFVASVFPGTEGKHVDIAAAKVIVEEAGGKVTDLFGNEQRYDRSINGAIVSNGLVHESLVELCSNQANKGKQEDI